MLQEHEPIGVLLADKQRAELYVFELGLLVDRSELLDELPRDYDSRGERERGTPAHHREELAHQHLRNAARAAFDLWQARGFQHLAIGAPDAIAGELEQALHPYLTARLCGRVPVGVGASASDVLRGGRSRRGRGGAEAGGRSGRPAPRGGGHGPTRGGRAAGDLGRALRSGAPSASWSRRASPRRDGARPDGALAMVGPAHPHTGATMERVGDVVEDAIEEALTQGIPVSICVGNADLDVIGRIGALLRY